MTYRLNSALYVELSLKFLSVVICLLFASEIGVVVVGVAVVFVMLLLSFMVPNVIRRLSSLMKTAQNRSIPPFCDDIWSNDGSDGQTAPPVDKGNWPTAVENVCITTQMCVNGNLGGIV